MIVRLDTPPARGPTAASRPTVMQGTSAPAQATVPGALWGTPAAEWDLATHAQETNTLMRKAAPIVGITPIRTVAPARALPAEAATRQAFSVIRVHPSSSKPNPSTEQTARLGPAAPRAIK